MNKISSTLLASATPGSAEQRDYRFYVGQEALKVKAIDKVTGAAFTVAYLCPTVGGDPIKREMAIDFAALACEAANLLRATVSMLGFIQSYKGVEGTVEAASVYQNAEAMLPFFREVVDRATRRVDTEGMMSPDLAAILAKLTGGKE